MIEEVRGSFVLPKDIQKEQAEKMALKEATDAGFLAFYGLDGVTVRKLGKPYYEYDEWIQRWSFSVSVGDPEEEE